MANNTYANNLHSYNGPKGNLGDFRHASRLFIEDNFKFAPKFKFLYHVFFSIDPSVGNIVRALVEKYTTEIGLLVKSTDLPKFSANVEVKNKYNRKKQLQTAIRYEPVNMVFHDDNYGITTALLEAYYKFYYADSWHYNQPGAYNKAGDGDNTFKGRERNQFRYGLDNNISVPFFKNIQITQMSRNQYTTYTLVNPIITQWSHDQVGSTQTDLMENSITLAYEAVYYERGTIKLGNDGSPVGFGIEHYDTQPSPLNGINTVPSKETKLPVQDTSASDTTFTGFNLKSNTLNNIYSITPTIDNNVGGLSNIVIPKDNGANGNNITTLAQTSTFREPAPKVFKDDLNNNPSKLESLAKQIFLKEYLNNGGSGGINAAFASWESLPDSEKEIYKNSVLETAL